MKCIIWRLYSVTRRKDMRSIVGAIPSAPRFQRYIHPGRPVFVTKIKDLPLGGYS